MKKRKIVELGFLIYKELFQLFKKVRSKSPNKRKLREKIYQNQFNSQLDSTSEKK